MDALRQFIDVKNNSFQVTLPEDFKASRVEVIIMASEQKVFEFSEDTKKMLDERLNDYKNNTDDVRDFDELLNELEKSI